MEQNAYSSFPEGTIHIIGIDSEINEENKHIAIALNGHYFVCANNGIMSMICSEINPQKIVEINIHDKISTKYAQTDNGINKDALKNIFCFVLKLALA